MPGYSEDALIEKPAIELFAKLGCETRNCFYEEFGERSTLGRAGSDDVVLVSRLRSALEQLNPDLPPNAVELAVEELIRDRSALHPAVANREVYRLLKDGVKVEVDGPENRDVVTVRVIDWDRPENNDFFLASQLWVLGDVYKRRTDLVLFVNGLPLVLLELKAVHRNLKNAFDDNLRDYKDAIPKLFWYNAFIILSNGSDTRVGTMTAPWEHFSEWKKVSDEEEVGRVSLETVILGTCEPNRLLDIVENFILYSDLSGSLIKIVARYHQFLGVNNAIQALDGLKTHRGRLGVFWHTQGSGKSYSMIFFSQKVLRTMPGNWTFVVVTDRQELDGQIYKNFAGAGVVTETEVQADSSSHLRRLLREDHRHVFTLIHKFRTDPGETHPVLSERDDVIVMTDEAHRTQYAILAKNMRDAVPNAAFIGFTGTPLIVGDEKTREVFGDYVSIYDFKQSWEDGSTVPLFYENRIPELQLQNEQFEEEIAELLDAASLDEEQEKKLEREFARQYHIITRDDRLETIAADLVTHFMGRGYRGKAMVVSIDKATAVRMYDKVQKYWQDYCQALKEELATTTDDERKAQIRQDLGFMEATDMAVVVSQGQNEVAEMRARGLDILPHRKRMIDEDLETKFKDADDPFRIVFVCAMWMTGFDVPSCSTIYLDKPMRNHTLMQTIARANRVFREKVNGLIVDYIGVFRNLQKALAIYGGGAGPGGQPILPKEELVAALAAAIKKTEQFCQEKNVSLTAIIEVEGFDRVRLLADAVEALIETDESKRAYLSLAADVVRLYKAILPDSRATQFTAARDAIAVLAQKIRSLAPQPDISGVMRDVEALLDRSVAAQPYLIKDPEEEFNRLVDLSQIDFETLKTHFSQGRKRTEAERLRSTVERALARMIQTNRTRVDFKEKLEKMIEEYNNGSLNIETFFKQLLEFAKELSEEDKRAIQENLTEEELTIVDLLTKPEMDLTKKERDQVKKAARELLATLKKEKLVLDWRKRQQSRAQVLVTIEKVLDRDLPEKFTPELYEQKCELIYQHIYDAYAGDNRSVYMPNN